jgi:hypothetical protein
MAELDLAAAADQLLIRLSFQEPDPFMTEMKSASWPEDGLLLKFSDDTEETIRHPAACALVLDWIAKARNHGDVLRLSEIDRARGLPT